MRLKREPERPIFTTNDVIEVENSLLSSQNKETSCRY